MQQKNKLHEQAVRKTADMRRSEWAMGRFMGERDTCGSSFGLIPVHAGHEKKFSAFELLLDTPATCAHQMRVQEAAGRLELLHK